MAPNIVQDRISHSDEDVDRNPLPPKRRDMQIVWGNVYYYVVLHTLALVGAILTVTSANYLTSLWAFVCYLIGGVGVTAGAHRLWSHRTYKATTPLRILLMLMYTVAGENNIFEWARDHRLHHRHSETEADPHNAKRGFFFAHMGWLLVRKQPTVFTEGRKLVLSDLLDDPVVRFNRRFYLPLFLTFSFLGPAAVPWLLWGEGWWTSLIVSGILKYVVTLHCTWLVNSAAHIWGNKPYDKTINPSENRSVALLAVGEGWHNYHHVFPWDYKAAELPGSVMNITTLFIDFMARIGWAYERKVVTQEVINRRAARLGDGSHHH